MRMVADSLDIGSGVLQMKLRLGGERAFQHSIGICLCKMVFEGIPGLKSALWM